MRAAFAGKAGRGFILAFAMTGMVGLFGGSARSNGLAEVKSAAGEQKWPRGGAAAEWGMRTVAAEGESATDDAFGGDRESNQSVWGAKAVRPPRPVFTIALHVLIGVMHSGVPLVSLRRGNSLAAQLPLAGSATSRTIVLQRLLL